MWQTSNLAHHATPPKPQLNFRFQRWQSRYQLAKRSKTASLAYTLTVFYDKLPNLRTAGLFGPKLQVERGRVSGRPRWKRSTEADFVGSASRMWGEALFLQRVRCPYTSTLHQQSIQASQEQVIAAGRQSFDSKEQQDYWGVIFNPITNPGYYSTSTHSLVVFKML